jgi:hypothetical protein
MLSSTDAKPVEPDASDRPEQDQPDALGKRLALEIARAIFEAARGSLQVEDKVDMIDIQIHLPRAHTQQTTASCTPGRGAAPR